MSWSKRLKIALYFLLCVQICRVVDAQWPRFGGVNGDFRAGESPNIESQSPGAWSLNLGVGDAPPIVDSGKVFVTEAAFTEDGLEAMNVRCIDLRNGQTLWYTLAAERSYVSQDISESYPVRPLASPLVSGQYIVALSYGGCVTCLEKSTGRIVWTHDLVNEFEAIPIQFGWASSPWSDGKNVVVACGGPQTMIVAFELSTGALAWKTDPGEAAFGSFAAVVPRDGAKHLCYVGRDFLFGFDPESGTEFWRNELPKAGLTNTVTPISLPDGELLVAGQGFGSSLRLRIEADHGKWTVSEVWKSQHSPFYCNWLADQQTGQIFGYNSKVLAGLSLIDGELLWKTRGWTDANFSISGNKVIGIRGDGFLAIATLERDGMRVQSGSRVVSDRVWTGPVLVDGFALIRGRVTLSCVDMNLLPSIDRMPSGTEVDSMNAMYGEKHESVAELLKTASSHPTQLTFDNYQTVVNDRSIRFGEGEHRTLLASLMKANQKQLALQIAQSWSNREPESIIAYDHLVNIAGSQHEDQSVVKELEQRSVPVHFDVTVPLSTSPDTIVHLAGNAAAVGSWRADGILLTRREDGHYHGDANIPKGIFEFKLNQGNWETVEVRADGGSISNRRRLIKQPMTIKLTVEKWNNKADK